MNLIRYYQSVFLIHLFRGVGGEIGDEVLHFFNFLKSNIDAENDTFVFKLLNVMY